MFTPHSFWQDPKPHAAPPVEGCNRPVFFFAGRYNAGFRCGICSLSYHRFLTKRRMCFLQILYIIKEKAPAATPTPLVRITPGGLCAARRI
jgi:hypothetical protein